MDRFVSRFIAVGLLAAFTSSLTASDVYVSTTGDDTWTGTKDKPLASLGKALAVMADRGPGTIWLAPGEYFLENGIALGAEHSGTAAEPLVIQAEEPGRVKLTGARVVEQWKPISTEQAAPLISDEAKKHVLVADLRAQGFPPLDPLPVQHRAHGGEELIFGDRPMQSARWPNDNFTVFTEVIDSGASPPVHWVTREVYRPGSFRFPGDRARRWDFDRGVWLHGFWCYDWCDEALKVKSYDPKTGEVRVAAKHAYGIGSPRSNDPGRRFYAVHVFEELDRPGEYYLDRKNQRAFFWPPEDIGQKAVRLTLCDEPVVRADDVSHLVVRDLVIENGRDTGISLSQCSDCIIENCLVRNMGKQGIQARGERLVIRNCEVAQTGAAGISVSGGNRRTLTSGECEVVDCHIHHVGRLDWMGGRGITLGGCGNHVAGNLIHYGPTGAVAYGGNEHVLELNEIHDMCHYYSDVGVFYTGRDWSSRGNVVRWNYIHDIRNNAGHGSSAIYLDDCDSGDTVVGNIVYGGVGRGVLLGGGRDNVIRGNIFIDLPIGIHVDARGTRGITLDKPGSWNLLAKCEQVGYQSPLWRERYPKLATIMDNDPLMPLGNSMRDNLFINCTKPFGLLKDVKPEWLQRENNVEWSREKCPELPETATGESLDLAIVKRLWERVPGFPPIPIDRIGRIHDRAVSTGQITGRFDRVAKADVKATQPEIWLCAGDRIKELFASDDEWSFVAQHLSGIKLYIGQLSARRGRTPGATTDDLRQLGEFLNAHKFQVAVELGGCLDFSPLDETSGEWSARHELQAIERFYAAGGRVDFLDLDGPIRRLLHPKNRRDGRHFDSIERAADELVDSLQLHRAAHPETRYWLLTNFPNWGWRGDVSYHARGPKQQDYGDYYHVATIVLKKLKEAGIELDGVTVDNPYDYLIGEHFSVKIKDPKTVDWLGRVRQYEEFARRQGLTFNLIANSERGGHESDERFCRESLAMVDVYFDAGGRPDRWFLQSWYAYPKKMLPESDPNSMTGLVKAAIERVDARKAGR